MNKLNKKYYQIELTNYESKTLKGFLNKNGIYFDEISSDQNFQRLQILATEGEALLINEYMTQIYKF